ncbi:MAG: molybdopterin molybdotransferase MoeA [Actinomycetales bacterium]|nr:molybdopterin molybdotransferase MoeA [Actinomycetales bacterium]
MRSIQDQLQAVLAAARPVHPLDVVLADAAGCVLAEDLHAPGSLPPRALAAHDGYALELDAISQVGPGRPVVLPVTHDVGPDATEPLRLASAQAVRVASGAPLPVGADVVVPVAYTDRGTARVEVHRTVPPGSGVRAAGTDAREGEIVLAAGVRLGASQIGIASALGLRRLRVHPRPRVVVLPVGDELVEAGAPSHAGRVHDANGPMLTTAAQAVGAAAHRAAIAPDDRTALREAIEDQLVRADLLVITGGLGDGPDDTVREVLTPLGTVRFDHVAMSPGRTLGFGTVEREGRGEAVPVFALPGHPVAAMVAFEVFVRPALRAMAGYAELFRTTVSATASAAWAVPSGLRQFVPATLSGSPGGGYRVAPLGDPAHTDLGSLARANAFAVVGERATRVDEGDAVHALVLDSRG